MSKIKSTLPLPGDEAIIIGRPYTILQVETFTSDVQGFVGVRVVLGADSIPTHALAIWEREVASRKSKMGAFLVALGEETDNWEGKRIIFISWTAKNREIQVASPKPMK